MTRQNLLTILITLSLSLLAACSRTPYTPVAAEVDPIDASMWAPTVDAFVVLLDTSGSMKGDGENRGKIQDAQDFVASFNSAVPPYDFQSSLVVFGKGAHSCIGPSNASAMLEMSAYDRAAFADALSSIKCAASTTPITDAIDMTTDMLDPETGPVAVVIVSDFRWSDAQGVQDALARLRNEHGDNLCLHTVNVGASTENDELIASMTDSAGCDSAANASDLASATAMSNYVTDTLLAPLEYETHSVSATALFGFDDSTLSAQGKAELANLADYIKSKGMGVGDIDVVGHTCSMGEAAYNGRLSVRRATAVKQFLVSQGIDAGMIDVSGMGETQPVADNSTEAGREQNRRVEIHVGSSRPG